jgi:hypothetical protein
MRAALVPSSIRLSQFLILATAMSPASSVCAGELTEEVEPVVAYGNQVSDFLEVTLSAYSLPNDLRQRSGIEDLLSSEVGVAGTQLVGMRVILTVPDHLRFERMEVEVADGLFLVRETSRWRSAGRFLMTVARWLLIGRLVSGGDELEVSATAWTMLLGGEGLEREAVALDTRASTTIERDDAMATHHGPFVVCRMVMAKSEISELINMTIWATELESGQPTRFVIPRLSLPAGEE